MLRRRRWGSRRWHSRSGRTGKSRRRMSAKRKWLIVLIVLTLFIVQGFIFVERNLKPPLMNLAKIRLKQIATQAINSAITERISQNTDAEKLIDWKMNKDGKVSGFMLNYTEHMRITADTVKTVDGALKSLGSVPEHIPLGQAMGSAIVASFGPNIPVRLVPQGAAKVELNTRPTNVGINMILVEVYIRIIAEVTVIIPFDTQSEIVETEIPVSYSLVVGDTPTYYFDNKGNPVGNGKEALPNLSLPNLTLPNGTQPQLNAPESTTTTQPSGEGPPEGAGEGAGH